MPNKRYPSCILASAYIPWDEKGQFCEELFREEVQLILRVTPHVYIMGTAGEGYAVSEEQFDAVVRAFSEEMQNAGKKPMVGVISLSVSTVLRRIERAKAFGVRQFQISLPCWGECTRQEIYDFFDIVCGSHRDCYFVHYNLARTKRIVTSQEYSVLARKYPNLVAAKNATDSILRIARLMDDVPEIQHFFNDIGYAYGALKGECGLIPTMCSCNWNRAQEYFRAGRDRNTVVLMDLHSELVRLNADLKDLIGDQGHIDGVFDKMYVRLHQPEFPLRLLPPYRFVSDETFKKFAILLRKKYPRWSC